jgi:hypothetical protein
MSKTIDHAPPANGSATTPIVDPARHSVEGVVTALFGQLQWARAGVEAATSEYTSATRAYLTGLATGESELLDPGFKEAAQRVERATKEVDEAMAHHREVFRLIKNVLMP